MRRKNLAGATSVVAALVLIGGGATAALADQPSNSTPLAGSVPAWADPNHRVGDALPGQRVNFRVYLGLRDQQGAEQQAQSVSDPDSPNFRHFLSAAEVKSRFSPTADSVAKVQKWLRDNNFHLAGVPANNLYVEADGTVDQVQRAFQTALGEYSVHGQTVRGAQSPLSVPAELGGIVTGIVGINQSQKLMIPQHTTGADQPDILQPHAATAPGSVAAPAGFRNSGPCSAYWAEKHDTTDPAYPGVPNPLPYAPCGYTPEQLRTAYGLSGPGKAGLDGTGSTVAIVDAFASPTLFSDAQQYSKQHDPQHVLRRSQYKEITFPPTPGAEAPGQCDAAGWYGEQALDVEAVHGMAPGADIVYVGGADCQDVSLDKAVNEVVSKNLAQIVSNSYGDTGEALPASDIQAFQEIATQAAVQGVGLYFSSGDSGDDAARNNGVPTPDFAASSPWVTAVGGTSLGIDEDGHRVVETGWETGKSTLTGGTWSPAAPGAFNSGSGGGTSRLFPQPSYQKNAVPDALATKNRADGSKGRVVPDISMDADPNTGMLIGLHQTFPDGTYYSEYRIGGTSLACPLLAGEMAVADQAKARHGFLNPLLYKRLVRNHGISDVTHDGLAETRVDFVNNIDAKNGLVTSVRTFDFQGLAIATTRGYDNVTGLGTPSGSAFLFLI